MSAGQAAFGVMIGFVSGVLSGLFGVGGGIVMTPGIQIVLGTSPIVALATPLPVIFPTALMGAETYRGAGEVDTHAALLMVGPGIAGAVIGAWLTRLIDTDLLLVVTAILLAYQAVGILRGAGRTSSPGIPRQGTPLMFGAIGLAAGLLSGLLGIGGGLIMVPMLAGVLGMPLKRTLGTSLLTIVALVVPGTIVHAALNHIDWAVFLVLTIGAVPGAKLGAHIALGAKERTLRLLVGAFLLVVALVYGISEVMTLVRG